MHGREQLFVTARLPNDAHSPDTVAAYCSSLLSQLNLSYLDLLLVEWPVAWLPGTTTRDEGLSLDMTWQAMEHLVDSSSVKFLGLGNCSVVQVISWPHLHPHPVRCIRWEGGQ